MIDLTLTRHITSRIPARAFFVRICEAAESALRIPKGHRAEIGITLLGSRAMRTINRKRRGIDKPTDVLSFPLHMKPITGYTAVLLGDVFICPVVVEVRAREAGLSAKSQLSWTVIHGLLHLAGYDHPDAGRSGPRLKRRGESMSKIEQRILSRLNR